MADNEVIKEQKIVKLKKNLKSRWTGSTIHGFHNIPMAKYRLTKLIWVLIFLISLVFFIYSSIINIQSYFEYNVVISSKIIHQSSIEFPTVSLCNLKMFAKNNTMLNEIVSILNQTKLNRNRAATRKTMEDNEKMRRLQYLIKSYASGPNLTTPERKSFGLSIEEMLVSCYFNGMPCYDEEFEWFYNYEYGNCFAFNSGFNTKKNKHVPLKNVQRAGQQHGLKLELFVGTPDKNDISLTYTTGLHIFFGNKSEISYDLIGIDVPTGFQTNIAIEKSIINQYPTPHNQCILDPKDSNIEDTILIDTIFNSSLNYSQNQCFDLCYQYNLIESCGCYDPLLPPFDAKKECRTIYDLNCDYHFFKRFTININNYCSKFCPPECNKMVYTYTTYNAQFPTKYYAEHFIKDFLKSKNPNSSNIDYKTIQDSNLAVSIYFKDIKYNLVQELLETSKFNLLSQIGGTMGMFLGASILSFFELFEIIIESFIMLFNCFSKKYKRSSENEDFV